MIHRNGQARPLSSVRASLRSWRPAHL
jgi:hypothetical protein